MRRQPWLDLLTYLSVAAVLIALIQGGLLRWPEVRSPLALIGAAAAMLLGFGTQVLAWRAALSCSAIDVRIGDAVASCGLSVFGKYLPGKVWLILGMAGRIASEYPIELADAVAAATRMQVISVWIGLLVGLPALAIMNVDPLPIAAAIGALLAGSAVVAVPALRCAVEARLPLAARVFAYIWPRNARASLSLLAWLACTWVSWGLGFGLLAQGLTGSIWPWQVFSLFPLAGVLGLLVLIAPGGIGAREGVLALALAALGMAPEQVASVSVFSRGWFLLGELCLFSAGVLAARWAQRRRLL